MTPMMRVRQALIALGIVFIISVVGHHILTGNDWLTSIYYFVITVSGVGYTEHSTATPALQLFSIFVILIGMFVVGYTITMLLQMMIEGQIYRTLGVHRMTQEIDKLSGHTVICGMGRMGRTLADEFSRRGVPFVVIDQDPDAALSAHADGILMMTGNALEDEVLEAAGIADASVFVAALHSDADNVFLTLTARNLNKNMRIIARGEMPATEQKLRQAGADEVVLPAVIGARRMAAMVTRPHTAELMDLMTTKNALDADLEELGIQEGSPLVGETIRDVATRSKLHVLVIGIRRKDGEMLFAPDGSTTFSAGDTLIALGKQAGIREFRSLNGL